MEDGLLKVLDFGLAIVTDRRPKGRQGAIAPDNVHIIVAKSFIPGFGLPVAF